VVRDGAHGIVGNAGWVGAADPGWVREEGIEAAIAALRVSLASATKGMLRSVEGTNIVKIDVDTTKVGEDEVANCVCALDRLGVMIEGR